MKRLPLIALTLAALAAGGAALASARPDGAVIRTSGSTNTAGYEVKLWSDGRAEVTMQGAASPRTFTVEPSLAASFFSDVKAARANPGTLQRCMKSASFGTATTVTWHGWTSHDLQCPPFNAPMQALFADTMAVLKAGNVSAGPRRIHLPVERRMIPSTSPEVSPT